jgi:hypothetical protein
MKYILLLFFLASCSTDVDKATYIVVPPNTVAILIPKEDLTGRQQPLTEEQLRRHLEEQYPPQIF